MPNSLLSDGCRHGPRSHMQTEGPSSSLCLSVKATNQGCKILPPQWRPSHDQPTISAIGRESVAKDGPPRPVTDTAAHHEDELRVDERRSDQARHAHFLLTVHACPPPSQQTAGRPVPPSDGFDHRQPEPQARAHGGGGSPEPDPDADHHRAAEPHAPGQLLRALHARLRGAGQAIPGLLWPLVRFPR